MSLRSVAMTLLLVGFCGILLIAPPPDGAGRKPRPVARKPAPEPRRPAFRPVAESPPPVTMGLRGRVFYDGVFDRPPPLVEAGDPQARDSAVCAAAEVPSEFLLVDRAQNNGLANVVVFLAPAGVAALPSGLRIADPKLPPAKQTTMGCRFSPRVLPVRVGQQVHIDVQPEGIMHNAHIFRLRGNHSSAIPSGRIQTEVYATEERIPVRVVCDLHPWMKAYHVVTDHPFVAVTDSAGRFEIPNLPAGEHRFRIWHELAGWLDRDLPVRIKAGEVTDLTLRYPAARFR